MELPEEVTEFPFLEKLQLYHNAIKAIPDTVGMLLSLNYLDLRWETSVLQLFHLSFFSVFFLSNCITLV